jgi:hypothetical protein
MGQLRLVCPTWKHVKHLPSLIRRFLVSSLRLLGAREAVAVRPQAVALFTEGVAAAGVVV